MKVNIISNSCVGARIYQLLEKEYNNPFMWNVIPYNDFKSLVVNYDKINLQNIDIKLFNGVSNVMFDNLVDVYYIHYHQDDRYPTTTKIDIDVHSKDIISYTRDKVVSRTERVIKCQEDPIFIFETRPREKFNAKYTADDVHDFINLNTKHRKIILTSFPEFKGYNVIDDKCSIIYYNDKHPNLAPDTVDMAKQIIKHIDFNG